METIAKYLKALLEAVLAIKERTPQIIFEEGREVSIRAISFDVDEAGKSETKYIEVDNGFDRFDAIGANFVYSDNGGVLETLKVDGQTHLFQEGVIIEDVLAGRNHQPVQNRYFPTGGIAVKDKAKITISHKDNSSGNPSYTRQFYIILSKSK